MRDTGEPAGRDYMPLRDGIGAGHRSRRRAPLPPHRDRAAERRKGLSVDHEGIPSDLVDLLDGTTVKPAGRPPTHRELPCWPGPSGGGALQPAACRRGLSPPPNRRPQGADLSRVTYEESKYLGGDVAHTHLVKGLDFALLQKARTPCSPCVPARQAARQAPAPFCPRASGRALCSAAAPWCDVAPA
jgi:hypothetical protein